MKKALEAKMKALQDLIDAMEEEEDKDFDGIPEEFTPKKAQKVTVMADSKEGLKKGLSKADEILSQYKEDESEEEEDEEMSQEPKSEMDEEAKEEMKRKFKDMMR